MPRQLLVAWSLRNEYLLTALARATAHPLEGRRIQVLGEVVVLEGHIRAPEVDGVQGILGSHRQALPGDKRLGPAGRRRQLDGVVDRPGALVLDKRLRPREHVAVRGASPAAVGGRADGGDVVRGRRRRRGEVDDGALPVVTVAKAVGRLVLGEVPGSSSPCQFGCIRVGAG